MDTAISQRIKERRKELGIDQQTLADLSGIGVNTLVAIERGVGNPSFDTLQKVTECLGLKIGIVGC